MSLQNQLELSAPVDLTLVTVYYTPEPLLPLSLTMETFSVREEQGRSIADRSTFRPEAQGKQLKKSKQSLEVRLATATGGKWGTNGRPFMTSVQLSQTFRSRRVVPAAPA